MRTSSETVNGAPRRSNRPRRWRMLDYEAVDVPSAARVARPRRTTGWLWIGEWIGADVGRLDREHGTSSGAAACRRDRWRRGSRGYPRADRRHQLRALG